MHLIVAVGLLCVLHVGQSHSPGLGLNMSASDGSSEEAACPFTVDIPSAEFLTATLAGCTGAALLNKKIKGKNLHCLLLRRNFFFKKFIL
jgi:hypothetical protein